nr:hypothetical protein [Tanacetum cinerariifolium]
HGTIQAAAAHVEAGRESRSRERGAAARGQHQRPGRRKLGHGRARQGGKKPVAGACVAANAARRNDRNGRQHHAGRHRHGERSIGRDRKAGRIHVAKAHGRGPAKAGARERNQRARRTAAGREAADGGRGGDVQGAAHGGATAGQGPGLRPQGRQQGEQQPVAAAP